MDCIINRTTAKNLASGTLKAHATVIHRPSKIVECTGSIHANIGIDINIGFDPNNPILAFGSSEPIFGSVSASTQFQATKSNNRLICKANLRILDSKQYYANNQVYLLDDPSDISNIRINSLRVIDVKNPYCDLTPSTKTDEQNGKLSAFLTLAANNLESKLFAHGRLRNIYTDKIAGNLSKIKSIRSFKPTQSLYPIRDIISEVDGTVLVNKDLSSGNLFDSINEGIAIGSYIQDGEKSTRISDDFASFIQPSSIFSNGSFSYKCEVSAPQITPKESFLLLRMAAPLVSSESDVPAIYTVSNITLEDPSGNLIVKYKDFIFRGDGNYLVEDQYNFTTYITEPEINYASLYTWHPKFPVLGEASGYTLNLDFNAQCLHKPFASAFSKGYEESCHLDFVDNKPNDYLAIDGSPISTRTSEFLLNPNNALRISAIEICNSGSIYGLLKDKYLAFHTEVQPTGNRLERTIYPYTVLSNDFDTGIFPQAPTTWRASPDIDGNIAYNTSPSGRGVLSNRLRNIFEFGYISLSSINGVSGSGKLQLQYKHEPPFGVKQQTGGAFNFGGKGRNKSLSSSTRDIVYQNDSFFTIDSIELQISARKAEGSPDYTIDVVGYSDDGVVNITPSVGGFLQNSTNNTDLSLVPLVSGSFVSDELAISSETLSDKDQYYESRVTKNPAGDHYIISDHPVVNSTSFQNYVIPLTITQDSVSLGRSQDYTMSSFFETLYLDIFPLPSGAEFAKANLVVKYKPSNAMPMHTFGYQEKELAQRKINIFPVPRKNKDTVINSIINDAPLSLIENIPHGYKSEATIKTNYSRRWRGVTGNIFSGPFDALDFDFAFENPQLEEPFLGGYFDFNRTNNNHILSSYSDNSNTISGVFNGNLASSLINNRGLRFNTNKIHSSQSLSYRSLDWTTLGHELYGKILDAFDNAVRISGIHGHINFGNISVKDGFSLFTRFTPDATVSGVSYNLFNSGVIISKWDNGANLELALAYKNGKLAGFARDENGNNIEIQDTLDYDQYQYPLSVLLTYNDNNSRKLKLYTDNEITSGDFNTLRASSSEFNLYSGNSNLVFGHSYGSGVGFNGFITEIGISTYNASGSNITESNNDSRLQQITANDFLETHRIKFWNNNEPTSNDRYKMWKYVDENTDDWHLGAFKYCEFFADYDTLKNRVGKDFIVHNFKTNGETYQSITNIPLPSSINAANLAYHSQIENDMLRFNLGGNTSRLFAIAPRISKALPRSYVFNEEGFVVDSIIQHECSNDIVWEDGKVGPRLIVSLYTKSKDSDLFDTTNWGLINRSIHYLDPKICWAKISSKFTLKDLLNTQDEPWSNFVKSKTITELNHKYYSKDIDEMFLQYDLAYPSGHYESKIKLHSAHVRLENALLKSEIIDNTNFTLAVSGEARERESLPLSLPFTFGSEATGGSGLSLYASGYLLIPETTSMPLFSSGAYLLDNNVLPLHSVTVGYIGAPLFTEPMFGSSSDELFGSAPLYGPTLFVAGRTDKYDDTTLGLYLRNNQTAPSAFEQLVLYTHCTPNPLNNSVTLSINGGPLPFIFNISASAPLFISTPLPEPIASSVAPLFVDSINPFIQSNNATCTLVTINQSKINSGLNQLESFLWNKDNPGKDITVLDNDLLLLPANDEIRGVNTICYGECDTNGTCQELAVITHDTKWYDSFCVDGGVFRALTTYTNEEAGYSGNFYGVRKLDKLIPQAPYNITIIGKTGSDGILEVPREMSQWEYGYNEDVGYSGVKFVPPSGLRSQDSKYGKSVAIKDDLMIVGAPYQSIYDTDGYELDDAGSVFVYRRNPEPSGFDWSNQPDKSHWQLETVLSLPDGFKRDYYTASPKFFFQGNTQLPFVGVEKQWFVGQEGRQLGHSVSLAKTSTREVAVIGGPSCKWTRTFSGIQANPVNIGLFIFTDEFLPTFPYPCPINGCLTYHDIIPLIKEKDILFKYFCDPAVSFNVEIIICEPVIGMNSDLSPDFNDPKPDFVQKFQINRHTFYNRNTDTFRQKNTQIFNDLKSAFESVFPYDETKRFNNIPPVLGFYIDGSASLGARAMQPALDEFIKYYQQYSFASGLKDFNDFPASGYANVLSSVDENWIAQAASILSDTLDTGRMITNNSFKLFANNLGQFNPNASEFNLPPASGGSVFIYEKEDYGWEIIQEIKSPTLSSSQPPDRFGHAVTISNSGNIIVVGSPYIDQAVSIYEYRPDVKEQKYIYFPSWLNAKAAQDSSFGAIYALNQKMQKLLSTAPTQAAARNIVKQTYAELSPSGKFEFRRNLNINEYELIKTVTYRDIDPGASWDFLVKKFAPTSRLGYSVATNDDGSLVAIGAPTDSMGAQDNAQIWWKPGFYRNTHWQSYVNAGAVRVLESRNYYPHNKVVEYGKFGNLHYLLSPETDSSFFNHMEPIYENNFGVQFERTSFADAEIPKDAGTLFIITPAVDSVSDEIVTKLQNWLSLGDRNLVLVGNDPVWENDGAYADSNLIINNLLSRLESRMRLHPARNKYESLVDNTLDINAIPASVPRDTTSTYVFPSYLKASGVSDIRFYDPDANVTYSCNKPVFSELQRKTYIDFNDKCEMPIVHNGDIRARFNLPCGDDGRYYQMNLAMYFGTITADRYCGSDGLTSIPESRTKYYEPIPIMAAAEKTSRTIVYPAIPERVEPFNYREVVARTPNGKYAVFSNTPDSGVAFLWSSESGNYSYLNTNFGSSANKSRFFDPEEYNGKNAILLATAEVKADIVNINPVVANQFNYAVEEKYGNTSSSVVLLAGTFTESRSALLSSIGDKNLNFYDNLVAKNEEGGSRIAQIGGWTKRSSFKDGYLQSDLLNRLTTLGNIVDENVSSYSLSVTSNGYDVGWIANTTDLPSDEELDRIVRWLNQGNKKLIITYGQDPISNDVVGGRYASEFTIKAANAVAYLCERLGLSMKPLFLSARNKYASKSDATNQYPFTNGNITINKDYDPIYRGKRIGSTPDSKIESYSLVKGYPHDIIPVDQQSGILLASFDTSITDDSFVQYGIPQLKTGIAKVTFPVIGGSGYRVYFDTTSESPVENALLGFKISNCSPSASFNQTSSGIPSYIYDYDFNDQPTVIDEAFIGINIRQNRNEERNHIFPITNYAGRVDNYYVDIQVPVAASSISIYVDGSKLNYSSVPKPDTIRTQRLISISGALLPIEEIITYQDVFVDKVGYRITPAQPEQRITTEYFREISTNSLKYCPTDFCKEHYANAPEIADGPVLVAQELYHQRPFDAGVARSRITLISDASLIQGRSIADSNGNINPSLVPFLGSLYPRTNFPNNNFGRQYYYFDKLVAPERGSPQKYINAYDNSGLIVRFNGINTSLSSNSFSDQDYLIDGTSRSYAGPLPPELGRGPTYMLRRENPPTDQDVINSIRNGVIQEFNDAQYEFGGTARFSGVINGKMYTDASVYGGMPELMKDTGYDYLDFDVFNSGYPGDLFGYNIAIKNNKIYIGSPFAAFSGENPVTWNQVNQNTPTGPTYGTDIGYNGGAGAVYVFEKNYMGVGTNGSMKPWSCVKKFRPKEISAYNSDQFGHSISIDGDILAIGAPGHQYENYTIDSEAPFIRKEFNEQFNIQQRSVYDLGNVDNRLNYGSGNVIENNGAIFTYENKISNWGAKIQSWVPIHKLVAQGYGDRTINSRFGSCIALDRSRRKDGDYTLVAGSPNHAIGSGQLDPIAENAGAAYTYDGMLRKLRPSFAHPESYIAGRIYGDIFVDQPYSYFNFVNSGLYDHRLYLNTTVFANQKGEIFIEASGQDKIPKGFIIHRPFVEQIKGSYLFGSPAEYYARLFVEGRPLETSGIMPIFNQGFGYGNVYNTLGFNVGAVLGESVSPPLGLYASGSYIDYIENSGLNLCIDGAETNSGILMMNIRGK